METHSGKEYFFAEVKQKLRRVLPVCSRGKEPREQSDVIYNERYLKASLV